MAFGGGFVEKRRGKEGEDWQGKAGPSQ